jgi:hypothetical protein
VIGYGIAINNLSQNAISEADVQFGSFTYAGEPLKPGEGVVQPHGLRKYYPVPHAVPDTAKVMWRTSNGVFHVQQIEVRKHVPHGFTGYITFQIRDNTVSLFLEKG